MATAVGHVLYAGHTEGIAFAVTRGLALTANHVVRDRELAKLEFAPTGGTPIALTEVEPDAALDVALLHLAADVDDVAPVARAKMKDEWSADSQPLANDPGLTGEVDALRRTIVNSSGESVDAIQLRADQLLDSYAGYSGSPVMSTRQPGAVVGVLVEQVLSRLSSMEVKRATNVLYAIPIEAVIDRFRLDVSLSPDEPVFSAEGGLQRVTGLRPTPSIELWRDRDLLRKQLHDLLIAVDTRIISIVGGRGIGKSALVSKVLSGFESEDATRDRFDDIGPLIYVSTRRSGAPSLDGGVTLSGVYQAVAGLWPEESRHARAVRWQETGVNALSDLWQALRDTRPVLVLDNMEDAQDPETQELRDADLVALLASACRVPQRRGPTIITTSRTPLSLPAELAPGVHVLWVEDGLDGEDAVAVIRSSATSGRGDLSEIPDAELELLAKRVEGRPHGLRLLGKLLCERPRRVKEVLRSASAPEEVLRELVSVSYESLDPASQTIWQTLALAGVPLSEHALLDLVDGFVDGEAAESMLNRRIDAGEIIWHERDDLVELHPLDADYVRRVLLDHQRERQTALDLRLAEWWASRRSPYDEWREIDDATPSKREYLHRWRAGQRSEAFAVLSEASDFLSRYGEAAFVLEAVAEADRTADNSDPSFAVRIRHSEGNANFFSGSLDKAVAAYERARTIALDAGLERDAARAATDLGTSLRHSGNASEGSKWLRSVAELPLGTLAAGDHRAAVFQYGLALIYDGAMDRAAVMTDRLAELVTRDDPPLAHAQLADLRALSALVEGDLSGALAAADHAIGLFENSASRDNIGYMLNIKGVALLATGDAASAMKAIEQGMDLAADYRSDRLEGLCALNLAWSHLAAGDIAAAGRCAKRSRDRLAANGVAEAASAALLAETLDTCEEMKPGQLRQALGRVGELTLNNPDLFRPTDAALRTWSALVAAGV
jgi:tetratricopeptide (TPR) repeat protein